VPQHDTVLLALHYQNDVLHADGKIRVGVAADSLRRAGVIRNAKALLTGARNHGVPVVFVRIAFRPDYSDVIQNCDIFRNVVKLGAMQEGSWGAEFYEGLGPLPEERVVTHNRISAFYCTDYREGVGSVLDYLEPRRLIIAGIATNYVVEHTARDAVDIGYHVTVVGDACSAGDAALHEASLKNLSLLADVKSTAEVVRQLGRRGTASRARRRR
jgi:nicotinamidase-related amidase